MREVLNMLLLLVSLAADDQQETLRIHGSNTVGSVLAPALVHRWLEHEGYRSISEVQQTDFERMISAHRDGQALKVEIASHGSSTGFTGVVGGRAQLAMSSRPIRPAEAEAFARIGGFDPVRHEYVIALDGIAVIVNPRNPLAALARAQLQAIFSGRIGHWRELGWPAGGDIHVYARDEQSGTWDTFASLVLEDRELVAAARRYESNARLSDDVAKNRGGIGFVSLPNIRQAKALAIHEEGTAPLAPTRFTVATEDYGLSRRLFFYVPGGHYSPRVASLMEFALSEAGQQVVADSGYVAQHIYVEKPLLPSQAPASYARLVSGASRLSLSIRFRPGATLLDSKAERDLSRIQAFLSRQENRNKRVMLMAFADGHETNRAFADQLSTLRAEYIASRLKRLGIPPTRVRGYGQALPVAADDSENGRRRNRRVEVWIYDEREYQPPLHGATGN